MDEENGNRERLPLVDDSHMNNTVYCNSEKKPMSCQHCQKQKDFDNLYTYVNLQKPGIVEQIKRTQSKLSFCKTLWSFFPILDWLPNYNWHTDIFHDVMAGFTVAVLHIPQGLAYSTLAGVPSIVGIYMAFFPVLIYALMGTSRHISMGTFAVICMMASKSVNLYASTSDQLSNKTATTGFVSMVEESLTSDVYTPIQVVSALSLVVGAWQLLLGLLRSGSLYVILSENLISGLISGAAISVIVSQMKFVFGLKIQPYIGALKVIYTIFDVVNQLSMVNYVSLTITLTVITILTLYNRLLKDYFKKWLKIALPMELLVIMSSTLISKYLDLPTKYNVSAVGTVPIGFPTPAIPPLKLCPKLILDGLVIGIVSFSVNISMASIFSEKHKYRIEANQELNATGCANMFGSMFSCAPFSASLTRSLVQEMSGGKTQLASIVSCLCLTSILLFIGPFFEPLPNCILAAIILVAMQGILLNVKNLPSIWRQSKFNGVIWLATFLSVILVDIDVGLGVGIVFSLLYIILLGQNIKVDELGNIPNTDLYVYIKSYRAAVHIPSLLILRIVGGMNFANKDNVCQHIYKMINKQTDKIVHVILDFTSVSYIDPPSVKNLLRLYDNMTNRGINVNISNCSPTVMRSLLRCDFFNVFPETQLYPSIHDAVLSTGFNFK